jgi:hypothetical protein
VQFDQPFTDIFAVQDAISDFVVRALALRLDAAERRQLASAIPTMSRPMRCI